MAHGFSCSMACGIFPDQGWNPGLLHWQMDSLPLSHQGGPSYYIAPVLCFGLPAKSYIGP